MLKRFLALIVCLFLFLSMFAGCKSGQKKTSGDTDSQANVQTEQTNENEATPEATVETTPQTTAEATVETTPQTTAEATVEATPQTTAEATVETTPQTTAEATPEATPEATTQPTAQATAQPTAQATTQPTAQSTTQPTAQATTQPTAQSTTQPTAQATTQPTAQATTQPTAQATTQPTAQATTQPTAKPTSQATVKPTTQPSQSKIVPLSTLLPYKGTTIKLKAMMWKGKVDKNADLPVIKKYKEMLGNIDITWEVLSGGDYSKKVSLYVASGDMPDLMYTHGLTKEQINQWGSNDILMDWSPYIDRMLNFKEFCGETIFDKVKRYLKDQDGRIYSAVEVNKPYVDTGWVFFDLVFVKNKLKIPETVEELTDSLRKIKKQNPNIYPFSQRGQDKHWKHPINALAFYNKGSMELMYDYENHKWYHGAMTQGFKDALTILNTWYKEKLLDPEFTIKDGTTFGAEVFDQKVAATYFYDFEDMYSTSLTKGIPFEYTIKELKKDGKIYRKLRNPIVTWASAVANKRSKNKDILAAMIDLQYSKDFIEMFHFGIEGLTYRKVNGEIEILPDVKNSKNPNGKIDEVIHVGKDGKTGLRFNNYYWLQTRKLVLRDRAFNMIKALNDNVLQKDGITPTKNAYLDPLRPSLTNEENDYAAQILSTIEPYIEEYTIKFITGEKSIEAHWDEFIKGLKSYGVDKLVNFYNSAEKRFPLN